MGSLTLVRDDTRGVLTDRQREILDFITQSIRDRGYPPTLREIGIHFGIKSTNGVLSPVFSPGRLCPGIAIELHAHRIRTAP